MIPFIACILALLSSVTGLCYSPMLHGFAPDVILPSMHSSEIYCPAPHVFDHFICMCVDPSVVNVRVPTEGRTSLELSLLGSNQQLAPRPPFRVPRLVGLPDMHVPGQTQTWQPVNPTYSYQGSPGTREDSVVPALNPYGTLNMPANIKAAAKVKLIEDQSLASKQQELLEKVRWQEQLRREAAVVAAAELAAAATIPRPSGVRGRESTLDLFMRDTLRRILYGY